MSGDSGHPLRLGQPPGEALDLASPPTRMSSRSLDEIAALCGADLEGDGSVQITGPCGLADAVEGQVSFLTQAAYAPLLDSTSASAVVVSRDTQIARDGLALLRCDDPEQAFTKIVLAFAPEIPPVPLGVDPSAVVDSTAVVAEGARVGPLVSVGPGAVIGPEVVLHAGVRVGAHSEIGRGTELHANVVLYPHTKVGERCVVQGGSVLGSDGFGFLFDGSRWVKTPQVGNVVLGDDVEIGAGCAVDCARFGSTTLAEGCRVDNLVHVGHNVQVGKHTLLLAQVGIAGSASIGDGVILAGQVGVAGHLTVGDGARVAAKSGVTKELAAGGQYYGYPAGPRGQRLRSVAEAMRAPETLKALKAEVRDLRTRLESALARLESDGEGAPGANIDDTPREENQST